MTSPKRIAIVSGFPITQNPRVVKEADLLSDAGFDVYVISGTFSKSQMADQSIRMAGKKWKRYDAVNAVGSQLQRIRWQCGRFARACLARMPIAPSEFRCRSSLYLDFRALTEVSLAVQADFYSLHLEPSMFIADKLIALGRPFSVDVEDWYSEDHVYGPSTDVYQLLHRQLRTVLNSCQFATTTSSVLAGALADCYGCGLPSVIYNSFPDSDFRIAPSGRSSAVALRIVWFSQTIGRGRGIELLMDAVKSVARPVEVHLRGEIDSAFREELGRIIQPPHSIHFYQKCPHHELNSWLSSFDIGYASEIPTCRSRDLTVTNKILQYLQANLCVIATNTFGQREVAESLPGAVEIVQHDRPNSLASILNALTEDTSRLAQMRLAARGYFGSRLEWPKNAEKLVGLFQAHVGGDETC